MDADQPPLMLGGKQFPPLPPRDSIRRILVCQLRQLGDVLMATPSIELLARAFPQAEVHVLTEKKCVPMLENNPAIARIWPIDKKALPTIVHQLAYYRKIAAQTFDLVVDFQQLPRCLWVVGMSGAKVRLGQPPPWYRRVLYTHWLQPKPAYAAAFKVGLLEPFGIRWQGERPRLYLTDSEKTAAKAIRSAMGLEGKRYLTVDTTHIRHTRRWPAKYYARLLVMLAERYPDLHFFLSYGPGKEESYVRELAALCDVPGRIHIPEALMPLRHFAACIGNAAMHLGNCSSPRHMAVALEVPSFVILGAGGNGFSFPSPEHRTVRASDYLAMPCQHCNAIVCKHEGVPCMDRLTPEVIFPDLCSHLETYGRQPKTSLAVRGSARRSPESIY